MLFQKHICACEQSNITQSLTCLYSEHLLIMHDSNLIKLRGQTCKQSFHTANRYETTLTESYDNSNVYMLLHLV